MEVNSDSMMDFNATTGQYQVLSEALRLAGYAAVCAKVLALTDAGDYPLGVKQAIGRLGERMASFNAGRPEAGSILHTIASIEWGQVGIIGVEALTTADRAKLIDIVMGVSKQIVSAEVDRLQALVATDTALPEGWADSAA